MLEQFEGERILELLEVDVPNLPEVEEELELLRMEEVMEKLGLEEWLQSPENISDQALEQFSGRK